MKTKPTQADPSEKVVCRFTIVAKRRIAAEGASSGGHEQRTFRGDAKAGGKVNLAELVAALLVSFEKNENLNPQTLRITARLISK